MKSPIARPARAGVVLVALLSALAVAVPAQADSGKPRPPAATCTAAASGGDERQSADETELAASVGLTVEQLDRGLRAAKTAAVEGHLDAAIAAFADAAGSTREAAEKVLTPIERSVRE